MILDVGGSSGLLGHSRLVKNACNREAVAMLWSLLIMLLLRCLASVSWSHEARGFCCQQARSVESGKLGSSSRSIYFPIF